MTDKSEWLANRIRSSLVIIRSDNFNAMKQCLTNVQDKFFDHSRDYDSARTDLLLILNDSLSKLNGVHMVNPVCPVFPLVLVNSTKDQCRKDFYSFLEELKSLQESNQPLKEAD
ncbi:MAG: hypothetical protein M8364_18430 [Methylobacter sp.]|uniref:hypothetical protein n=1 Tax=Methylobacter sp. TaxID=2051955 RepID=UPI0025910794|nr:hypothetical protein [Methylobacter sp.]MCL7422871.1 hypothetical protein [Methylobacter sp.]